MVSDRRLRMQQLAAEGVFTEDEAAEVVFSGAAVVWGPDKTERKKRSISGLFYSGAPVFRRAWKSTIG